MQHDAMQPQRGSIRAFFKPAGPKAGGKRGGPAPPAEAIPAASVEEERLGQTAGVAEEPAPALQQFSRKRRRTDVSSAGAAAPAPAAADAGGRSDPPTAPVALPAATAAPATAAAAAAAPRQLTQMFLDVGQRHFHSYRCPTCGMLYARGTETDERLHTAFHAAATQGPRYQGWQGERVAAVDGAKGRVLLFAGVGAGGRGPKQLQELGGFLEGQMGLPQGWLLQAPLTVLLYVSAARRIQGFVAAEGIKSAFHVQPRLPAAAAQGMRSCGSAALAVASGGSTDGGGKTVRVPPAAADAAAPDATGARVATSGRSVLSVTLSSGTAVAAAECSSGGGEGAEQQQRQQEQQQQQQHGAATCFSDAQQQQQQRQVRAGAGSPSDARSPLALDRRRRVRAVCGVRLMWVSLEARRSGLASRLLDACRCHFMPGYVLPRHELAFSAPTDDGQAFIEEYAGTRRFLVYE